MKYKVLNPSKSRRTGQINLAQEIITVLATMERIFRVKVCTLKAAWLITASVRYGKALRLRRENKIHTQQIITSQLLHKVQHVTYNMMMYRFVHHTSDEEYCHNPYVRRQPIILCHHFSIHSTCTYACNFWWWISKCVRKTVWVSDIFEFLWYYCQPDDNFTVASHADDEQHLKTYGNNVTEQREEEKG